MDGWGNGEEEKGKKKGEEEGKEGRKYYDSWSTLAEVSESTFRTTRPVYLVARMEAQR